MKKKLDFFRKRQSQRQASYSRGRGLAVEMLEDRRLLHASGPEPTDFEQFQLELINRARANPGNEAAGAPAGEVQLANNWIDATAAATPFTVAQLEWENGRASASLNEGLAVGTISATAKQPLAFNLNAIHAARDYSEQLAANNTFGHGLHAHTGGAAANRTSAQRFDDAGLPGVVPLENLSGFPDIGSAATAEAHHFNLFIDSGIAGRGHRTPIMNDSVREVGIGLASDTDHPCCGGGNASLATQNYFSRNGFVFLTGVAYNDSDNNNFYTPGGEGLGGVTISATPTGGGAAVTTQSFASGGYSLALANGTYTVTFGTTAPVTVTINGSNVKQDFVDPVGAATTLWQNRNNPLDVDDDGDVSPIDVLQVINELNQPVISLANGALPAQGTKSPPPFLDVDGDSFVSPLDALVVINALNAPSGAEGEAVQTPFRSAIPEVWWLPVPAENNTTILAQVSTLGLSTVLVADQAAPTSLTPSSPADHKPNRVSMSFVDGSEAESEQKSTPLWTELTDRFFSLFLNNP